ncbi:hypothetical protein P1S61_33875 [Streptomyces sp. ME08-AFT2]|uniref:hypothetical protein n=1 Tax=Streptomyces sp. ME08-AFT2 TaxID=3028683 RepID=UPI0029B8174A|nr:hypothetical protein [Streptomyces sp. ME08-AFT2]MDX3313969.1 hypothetical protein [Streptomyces sp. ME08-AFT2]
MTAAPLSPETVTNLVQLRTLLASADQASLSTSLVTRPMAVVLLDAVNERVTHFAATFLNLTIPNKAGFEQLMEIVKGNLGGRWTTATWPEIRRLHRTRNLIQHEGLEVDQKNVSVWAAATSSYTRSLVSAVWDVDINEVTLSQAIRDSDIRNLLEESEKEISAGSPFTSLRNSAKAFESAYDSWRKTYRRRTPFHRKPMSHDIIDTKGFKYLEHEISEVNEAAVAIALSGNPGEYVWFRDITSHVEDMRIATLDEAQRALGFVFGWVIRWEAFRESFIPNRRMEREKEKRRVRSSNTPARVYAVSVSNSDDRFEIVINLADVPPDQEFDAWRQKLTQLLNKGEETPGRWRVSDSGSIIAWPQKGSEASRRVVENVSNALDQVDSELRHEEERNEKSRNAKKSEAESYKQEFETVRSDFPTWVEDVWLTDTVTIMGGKIQSRLRLAVPGDIWRDTAHHLRQHPLVESCVMDSRDRSIHVTPQFTVADLKPVLASISEAIEALMDQRKEKEETEERLRYSLEAQLRQDFHL